VVHVVARRIEDTVIGWGRCKPIHGTSIQTEHVRALQVNAEDGWATLEQLLSSDDLRALRSDSRKLDVRPTEQVPVIRWAHREAIAAAGDDALGFIPYW